MKCRNCFSELNEDFIDLGFAPPSNAYLRKEDLAKKENYYPLKVKVCDKCWLVQTIDYLQENELFNSEYAYFSSTSKTWLKHSEEYSEKIINLLSLNNNSLVIEIASNDGYLLKNFKKAHIPCIGIEPTEATALYAESKGLEVIRDFFGERMGKDLKNKGKRADLLIGNNVYAHVPNIVDFTKGLKEVLKEDGTITLEFPHLMELIKNNQFDTIYHEHFSYLSLYSVCKIFKECGLRVWDVERLNTHGGSLRVYGCHLESKRKNIHRVDKVLEEEKDLGLLNINTYKRFSKCAKDIKLELLNFLVTQKLSGKKVVGYGAAAKGNTLLNFSGVKPDLIPYVCDAALSKQGKYMPGSHIPIVSPEELFNNPPDFVLILPWNIAGEVRSQLKDLEEFGTTFVVAIPKLFMYSNK